MTNKKEKDKKLKSSKKPRQFFNFQKNKFSKITRDYHHELLHITIDLMCANRKLQESAALCHQQISFIKKRGTEEHNVSPTGFVHFENALYHLENFTFRVTCYRDKMVQFINQALGIGFDEKTTGALGAIINNKIVKDAHLDTELKKFNKDKDFKDTLNERTLLAHRRYYKAETGYDYLMRPNTKAKDASEKSKLWKQNIQAKTSRANRIIVKMMDINDRVVQKINEYLKKNPNP